MEQPQDEFNPSHATFETIQKGCTILLAALVLIGVGIAAAMGTLN